VIAPPGLGEEVAAELAEDVAELLSKRYPDVEWKVSHLRDSLVAPPVHLTELVDATRARMLDEDWDLAVLVTELPLRLHRRPLLSHASPTHGVALVSLPAHGILRVGPRLIETVADAVSALVGDAPKQDSRGRLASRRRGAEQRLAELAGEIEGPVADGIAFPARVVGGNVRLLLGMIRANGPWRFAARLSRALVGALAVATVTLILHDVWRIAASLDVLRLTALTVIAVGVAVVMLIVEHSLWERTADPRAKEQVTLFNLTTLATITLGIVSLYVEVFGVVLLGSALLIDSSLLADEIGHAANVAEYLRIAWLVSSLATVGGALGGALESDDAVREAAYAYRPADERVHA
jgi:uncharacterized membrane protein